MKDGIWGKNVAGRGKSKSKGPEAEERIEEGEVIRGTEDRSPAAW